MRSTHSILTFCLFLLAVPVWAQQIPQQAPPQSSKPTRDAQAIDVLGKALNAAGGASVLGAISDYTGSGTVTYHWAGKDVRGNVNLAGRGLHQFRMDSSLSTGVRSWAASRGTASEKSEDGRIVQVWGFSSISPSSLVFPYMQLVGSLKYPSFSLSYEGLVQIDGHTAHDVRVQLTTIDPASRKTEAVEIGALDFFIDTSSFQVLMTRDMARLERNSQGGPPHDVRFSDYKVVNNALVPFSISETIAGQQTWIIHLDSISFNSGLADSDFKF